MAGPNLEVFKFAVYVFLPVFAFLHYGDPAWYDRHVIPYRDRIFPPEERLVKKLPTDHSEIAEELARIKAEKRARKQEREKQEALDMTERTV